MKRVYVLAFVAACGAPTPTPRKLPPVRPVTAVTGPVAPVMTQHKLRAVVEGPHAGAIEQVAATPEGDAALTIDELGGARLWAALDGTREPTLVELPAAREIAIGHRTGGYTAVVRDEVGGLYIAQLDADGRTLAHTTVGIDPPFAGMVMTSLGLLAWRTDHHVQLIDGSGAIQVDLPTEPQQRVVDIAVDGTKALALLETDGKRKARWLTLQPTLAWGRWIEHPDQTDDGAVIALGPGATKFAVAGGDASTGTISIYTAMTGAVVNRNPVVVGEIDLRFVDEHLLAVATLDGGLRWMTTKDKTPLVTASTRIAPARRGQLLAVGGGKVIAPRASSDLLLTTPSTTEFLGYDTLAPQLAAAGPDGTLLLVDKQTSVLLGANLRQSSTAPLTISKGGSIADVELVGGTTWLVQSLASGGKQQLALVDVVTGSNMVLRDALTEIHYLAYEPSTSLVTLSFGPEAQVARLDAAKSTLAAISQPPARKPFEEVALVPLDPTLARGNVLVQIAVRERPTLSWFKNAAALDKPSATLTVDGAYLGTDPTGRVYAWKTTPSGGLKVAIYTDGKETGSLPTAGPASLWPDATGARVVEASATGITLYKDGKTVWTRPVDGVHEVVWLTDGALVLVHSTGVVRVDSATGQPVGARCGWGFGLSTQPHPAAPRIESICTQLSR
jgi:hypothetical protein